GLNSPLLSGKVGELPFTHNVKMLLEACEERDANA
ncbi:unnamed protein product, partial [marine sediment metagenome]